MISIYKRKTFNMKNMREKRKSMAFTFYNNGIALIISIFFFSVHKLCMAWHLIMSSSAALCSGLGKEDGGDGGRK